MKNQADALTIVVIGASGDLARKKIYPALFALYCQDYLPKRFSVFGFARSGFSDDAFRAHLAGSLTCRHTPPRSCAERMQEFLSRCFYQSGRYDSRESFLDLYERMRAAEDGRPARRLFYLAVPSTLYADIARAIAGAGLVTCGPAAPASRVVIEKPFGRDRESSDRLTAELARVFVEEQTYRIDHYLGKEVIQNLMVLRFANLVFEPIWCRTYIQKVVIHWKEDIGVGDRAGYFDGFGIIRDVMQNHLLQILSLVAMEKPTSAAADHVRDEKVRVLKAVAPPRLDDIVIGQYAAAAVRGTRHPAYTEEKAVPKDSLAPTYAAAVLRIDNERWKGVPFVLAAGKALDERLNEVRIQFRAVPDNIFCGRGGSGKGIGKGDCLPANALVIHIQPDESLHLSIINKEPGLDVSLAETALDLRYQSAFKAAIPEAYECLLLDVIGGNKSLFIRSDELAAAWDIFTPALHEMESRRVRPEPYPFGSAGPAAAGKIIQPAKSC